MATRPRTQILAGVLAVSLAACASAPNPVPSPTPAALTAASAAPGVSGAPGAPSKSAQPGGPGGAGAPGGPSPQQVGGPQYTIEQAVSDRAQENTIAFDALGFLTGNLGADSFFPPGKVADFWGFQYLRDNDPSEMGHNTDFLTRASIDTLAILTGAQRQQLITLAKAQVASIQDYGYKRFVLIKAFRRLLDGDLPSGTTGLSVDAVKAFSASLYQLDGQITLERAKVMGPMLASLTAAQKASLDAMVGKGMTSWPASAEPAELTGLSRDVKENVMTYAGDLFSWYAGDIEADTYFCPERHGTYFGSFYLKDAPAVGNAGYTIDTTITGNLGAALLSKLDATQAATISGLVNAQRGSLARIVETRRSVSTELRKLITSGSADTAAITALMATYGQLDGEIVHTYAVAFASVGRTLTTAQKAALQDLRTQLLGGLALPTGAYLYSQPIAMPSIPGTDFLFK